MTKRSPIPSPRLYRPILPSKKAIEAQLWCKPERLQEHSHRRREDSSLTRCVETTAPPKIPKAILVTDDEIMSRVDSIGSTLSSFSAESRCDMSSRRLVLPNTSRSGVYYENVEIRRDIHPLQSCRGAQVGTSALLAHRQAVNLTRGVPLAAAPKLLRHDPSSLGPLSCPASLKRPHRPSTVADQKSNKKQRLGGVLQESQTQGISDDRLSLRATKVKEASFMIEAAVALSKLRKVE